MRAITGKSATAPGVAVRNSGREDRLHGDEYGCAQSMGRLARPALGMMPTAGLRSVS